jgi:hypothetical protein
MSARSKGQNKDVPHTYHAYMCITSIRSATRKQHNRHPRRSHCSRRSTGRPDSLSTRPVERISMPPKPALNCREVGLKSATDTRDSRVTDSSQTVVRLSTCRKRLKRAAELCVFSVEHEARACEYARYEKKRLAPQFALSINEKKVLSTKQDCSHRRRSSRYCFCRARD